ncbi:MAG: hypothetical protein KF774_02410 [Planctomyces sp.]|nr:hypothetical protein [Planctomyces sp.]
MLIPAIITESTTADVTINIPGIVPMNLTYKPMTLSQHQAFVRRIRDLNDAASDQAILDEIAARVVTWSLDAPVSAETVGRLQSPIGDQLYETIFGTPSAPKR